MSPRVLDRLVDISMSLIQSRLDQEKIHWAYILDKNDRIVSIGQNSGKTHPLAVDHNYPYPNLHAELDSLIKLPKHVDIYKSTMVNIRLSRKSARVGFPIFRMSKPCTYCTPWILATKFRSVYYTTNDGFALL